MISINTNIKDVNFYDSESIEVNISAIDFNESYGLKLYVSNFENVYKIRNKIDKNSIIIASSHNTMFIVGGLIKFYKRSKKYSVKFEKMRSKLQDILEKKEILKSLEDNRSEEFKLLKEEIKKLSDKYDDKKKKLMNEFNIFRLTKTLPMPTYLIKSASLARNFDIFINEDNKNIIFKRNNETYQNSFLDKISIKSNSDFEVLIKEFDTENSFFKPKVCSNLLDSYYNMETLVKLGEFYDDYIPSVEIPSLNSISLGDVQPVAELKTNIMASLVASGAVPFNKTLDIDGEDVAVHQIMKRVSSVENSIINGEQVIETTYKWVNIMGQYNLIRKEFKLIEE